MNNENFDLVTNDENEEFTVEFGEVINDGGTHDYNELDNQPQINGHTLEGNKTNEQLGIPVYSAGENITISDDYVISATGGGGGSAVNSVNGQVGDVILTTSDLENTSDYQTGTEVESAISTAIAGKQDTLTAGNNITISNNTISATDTTYTAGTGLALNGTQFSVDTTAIATQSDLTAGLATKQDTLTAGANVQINNNTISATDTTYSDFTGTDGTAAGAAGLVPAPATTDAGKFLKADGTWDTAGGSGPTVVQTTGTSTTSVMSQNAVTSMVFADPSTKNNVQIGGSSPSALNTSVAIGAGTAAQGSRSVGIGPYANTGQSYSVALGASSSTSSGGEVSIGGANLGTRGYNNSSYRLLTNVYDPQNDHDAATKGYVDTALQSISSSDVISALGYTPYNSTNPNGYTSNVGTITGITMNGASKGTSGVVDLGTVITSHQDISGKVNTSQVKNTMSTTAGDVYDVRYINNMIGDVETILTRLTTGSGV